MAARRITLRQILQVAVIILCAGNLTGCNGCNRSQPNTPDAAPEESQEARTLQPVQEYSVSFEEDERDVGGTKQDLNPFRFYTHIGTDYGRMGPGERKISWKAGKVCVDLRSAGQDF